ncbi:hypothetical protein acdb102_20560 [Acidothermaceae bacterium B102]|nr:hypothetical protein acdb102_20560 [Acidothermaceae bacterium B102]
MSALRTTFRGVALGVVLLAQAAPAAAAPPRAHVVALSASSGHQQWKAALSTASVSSPLLAGDTVVVAGTNDCLSKILSVTGLAKADGHRQWRTTVGSDSPCAYGQTTSVSNGVALVGGPRFGPPDAAPQPCAQAAATAGGPTAPVALSTSTGHVLWHAPAAFATGLAMTPTVAIGVDNSGTCLVGLDVATGHVSWTRNVGFQVIEVLVTPAGVVLWAQTRPGVHALEGLDLATGKARWTAKLSKPNDSIQVMRGELVTVVNAPDIATPGATNDTSIDTYDPANGKVLWRERGFDQGTGYSSGGGALLVLRSHPTQSQLTWLDARTGKKRWSLPPQGRGGIQTAITDGKVVIGETANTLVGLSPATGKLRWTSAVEAGDATLAPGQVFVTQPETPNNVPGGD